MKRNLNGCSRVDVWSQRSCLVLLVACFALFSSCELAEAFVICGRSSIRQRSPISLFAQGNKRKGPVGKTKKKTKRNSNNKQTRTEAPSAGSSSQRPKNKKSKPLPPWQVLNTKEAKKNIEKEKQRRELVKQGVKDSDINLAQAPKVLSKGFLKEPERRLLSWKPFNPEKRAAGMRFVGAFLDNQLPPRLGVPEIAFLGRSNVGKSSLLNRLAARSGSSSSSSDQARVGKTPGATASVNMYTLKDRDDNDLLGFVDLPGFGYAKLSKDVKESVQAAAENYLGKRKELALGILLVDIRRTPSDDDRAVLAALFDMGVPIVVIATKADKISGEAERERHITEIEFGLGLPEGQPLCVSSVTGEGTRSLWRIILEACETHVEEARKQYEEGDEEEEDEELELELDAFEDSDDLVYNQGYDWIHDDQNSVYSDGQLEEHTYSEDDAGEYYEDEEEDDGLEGLEPQRETLKSLKKRAREMERRGDL